MQVKCRCGKTTIVFDSTWRNCPYCGNSYAEQEIYIDHLIDTEKMASAFYRSKLRKSGVWHVAGFVFYFLFLIVYLNWVAQEMAPILLPNYAAGAVLVGFLYLIGMTIYLNLKEKKIKRETRDTFPEIYSQDDKYKPLFL